MLKYKIEHFYGSQEKHDLQLVKMNLDVENLNEKEALENGWLYHKKWYQCRSVRIKLSEYKSKPFKYEFIYSPYTSSFITETVNKIYKEYIDYKQFNEKYDVSVDPERTSWLILKDKGEPVAFTKFNKYDGGIESQFTAWNYHKPKLSIGKAIVDYEISIAEKLGYEYLYIGQGCENGSKYKADFSGFEWWTGSEWSKDKELYKKLCSRDSEINNLNQLAEVYNKKWQNSDLKENIS